MTTIEMETHTGVKFLLRERSCARNDLKKSPHRSPWSNQYEPALDDGAMPSERLRKLEIDANTAFDQYREMYFEGGVSSVYLWDLDHGFAGTQSKRVTHKSSVLLGKPLNMIFRSYSYQEGR